MNEGTGVGHLGRAGECRPGLTWPRTVRRGETPRSADAQPRVHSTHFQVERVLLLFEAADVPSEHPLLGAPTAPSRAVAPTRLAKLLPGHLSASSVFSPDDARRKNP